MRSLWCSACKHSSGLAMRSLLLAFQNISPHTGFHWFPEKRREIQRQVFFSSLSLSHPFLQGRCVPSRVHVQAARGSLWSPGRPFSGSPPLTSISYLQLQFQSIKSILLQTVNTLIPTLTHTRRSKICRIYTEPKLYTGWLTGFKPPAWYLNLEKDLSKCYQTDKCWAI